MTSTIQMNARIDRELKGSGDAALAQIGLSPTQAIRALWEKASRRGKDLEEVAQLLLPDARQKSNQVAQAQPDDVVLRGWELMESAYASLGIDPSTKQDYPSDSDVLEAVLYEKLTERGLA